MKQQPYRREIPGMSFCLQRVFLCLQISQLGGKIKRGVWRMKKVPKLYCHS